jgi:hypothetical protein
MPSPLVNRYAIYFELPDHGKVPQSIAREPSLLMAVENCLNTYQAIGHAGFVIDDTRAHREFHVQRDILLQLVFLRHQDRTRYFEILNRLDRQGGQDELVSFLAAHARM